MRGCAARTGSRRIRLEIVHKIRLSLHALKPGLDGRILRELDPGVAGDMGVGVETDVRDGVVGSEEEVVRREVPLEDVERVPADLLPAFDERLVPFRAAGEDPETARADVRLEQVLLEEEPLRGARSAEPVARQEACSLGQLEEDRARLREVLPGLELEHRRPAGCVSRHVLRCLRLAREEVDRNALELETELGRKEPHLVTVGGGSEVVETKHGYAPFTCER